MTTAAGDIEDSFQGNLIKVLEVVDGGWAFFGRLSDGRTARFSFGETVSLARGDVVLVSENRWALAPDASWPDDAALGVERRVLDDGIIIETGVSLRVLKGTPKTEVAVGNTVECNDIDGIVRVISKTPLRIRDFGVDNEDLNSFLVPGDDNAPSFASFGGYHDVRARAVELIETQEMDGTVQVEGAVSGTDDFSDPHVLRANRGNANDEWVRLHVLEVFDVGPETVSGATGSQGGTVIPARA